jgi:hypothetical protein
LQGAIDNLLGKPEADKKPLLEKKEPKSSKLRLIKEEVDERKGPEGSSQDS